MKTEKIAKAIKAYLVDLAVKDKLPFDMTQLSESALEEVIKKELPTKRDKSIELASHYLSDGDLTTKEMVEAIANHEDQNDIIDNVDGVVVWQKVEGSFTCEDFLNEINY
jgi:antitoxin component of RelBE/YafQ-DinJ toxin-antitoxin module